MRPEWQWRLWLAEVRRSLAGRVGLLPWLPFSRDELEAGGWSAEEVEEPLFRGAYPAVHDRGVEPSLWYANDVSTYVERDVRRMINVRDLSSFQRFLRMGAGGARVLDLWNVWSTGQVWPLPFQASPPSVEDSTLARHGKEDGRAQQALHVPGDSTGSEGCLASQWFGLSSLSASLWGAG